MKIDWRTARVELFETGTVRWPARLRELPRQAWFAPHYDLWVIWAGRGRVQMRSGWVNIHPGICLLRVPGQRFPGEQDPEDPIGMSYAHFRLSDSAGRDLLDGHPDLPELFHPREPALAEAVGRRVVNLLHGWGAKSPVTPQARQIATTLFSGLLMDLLAQNQRLDPACYPGADPRYARILQLAQKIVDQPQKSMNLKKMAASCDYSPDHFRKIFKQLIGRSPNDFIVHWRIEMAKRLLAESSLSVEQIAETLGYHHATFFIRQFHTRTRQTPGQFRVRRTQ